MNNAENNKALFNYVLALADDSLVLGQRLSEWCRNAPFLEEDLAMANTALDYIGRARMFYDYAAQLEGRGRSEDDLAFLRDCRDYRNLLITELPRGDFAFTIARQLILDIYYQAFLHALTRSADAALAAIAAKAVKETDYHLRRSRDWVLRLGDGTEESHRRMQDALDYLWDYTGELFAMDDEERQLLTAGIAVNREVLRESWEQSVTAVLTEATLSVPQAERSLAGGRSGYHTEHLGYLLAEMQFMQRAWPGLEW